MFEERIRGAMPLAADKILGDSATEALVKPYYAAGESGTLSTGVGIMTKANISDFLTFWNGIGISSQ